MGGRKDFEKKLLPDKWVDNLRNHGKRKFTPAQSIECKRSIASTFCNQLSSAIIVSHYTQSKKFST